MNFKLQNDHSRIAEVVLILLRVNIMLLYLIEQCIGLFRRHFFAEFRLLLSIFFIINILIKPSGYQNYQPV